MAQRPVNLQRAVDERLLIERLFTVRADEMEETDDRTIPVVFSTEAEAYQQFFGREVLSHDQNAVDLSRMLNKTAPVLSNHKRDSQIGVVENARIVNRQGVAELRFSKGEMGDEIYRDVLDGIRSQISVGYQIRKFERDDSNPADPLFTITEWKPYEISVVSINADENAIVKRAGYFYPDDIEAERNPQGKPFKTQIEVQRCLIKWKVQNLTWKRIARLVKSTSQVLRYTKEEKPKVSRHLQWKIIGKRGTLSDFEQALRDKRTQLTEEASKAETETERDANLKNRFSLSDMIFQTAESGRGTRKT